MSSPDTRRAGARSRPSPSDPSRTRVGVPAQGVQRPGARIAGTLRVGGTQVSDVQRARMLRAAMEVVGELGYGGMSVARVTGRAGVSRRTFYDLFTDREDCFLAVFGEAVTRASRVVTQAAVGELSWRARLRSGLTGLLEFFEDEPLLGSLVVVDALAAGPRVLESRALVLAQLITLVDMGRDEVEPGREPPPLTAEGVVGAVLAVVHARMLERDRRSLLGLLNPLMGMIVLPYLGRAAAAQELRHPLPKPSRKPRSAAEDPLEGLEMRLTYRTLRVLSAIASSPAGSNRLIADIAGVQDQGQISKLLTRLETLGLIRNTGQGQVKGEPNAWTLTAKGLEVERSIETRAEQAGGTAGC